MEILFMAFLAALLIAPPFIFGVKAWGWFMSSVVLLVLIAEAISIYAYKGITISRIFWQFKERHPRSAWAILAAWTAGWVGLMWHLGGK